MAPLGVLFVGMRGMLIFYMQKIIDCEYKISFILEML